LLEKFSTVGHESFSGIRVRTFVEIKAQSDSKACPRSRKVRAQKN
jgi:hypothetical protein